MADIFEWVHDIIDGVGGLHDFERHEMPVFTRPRDEEVAIWVLRCLGNVHCVGADEVLDELKDHRGKQDIAKIVQNIEQMRGLLDKDNPEA